MILGYVSSLISFQQLLAFSLVFVTIRLGFYYSIRKRRYKLFKLYGIPGPEPNLFSGNHDERSKDPSKHKIDEQWRSKFGKTFGYFSGDEPCLVSTDLDFLKVVFLENVKPFKGRSLLPIRTPTIDSILFTSNYQRWEFFRKIMSPAFSSFKVRGQESMAFIEEAIKSMLEFIETKFDQESAESGKKKIQLDVLDLFKATALHTISHIAINLPGIQVKENEPHVKSLDEFMATADHETFALAIKYPYLRSPIEYVANHFEFNAALSLVNATLNSTIDNKLAQLRKKQPGEKVIDQSRLIESMIKLHHDKKMTRSEVISNCLAILLGGYDTTSTTLTYTFWALARHQEIQEKLRTELMTYGTESQYLEQVLNESMRLYPVVISFTSRIAAETVTINDTVVPQGTKVIFNSWLVHRDPEIWENPNRFDPERFGPHLEHHPCAFAPFGLGIRKCVGLRLAMIEMKMIICDILLRYKIKLISPKEMELITYSLFLSKPKEKVLLELEPVDNGLQ